MSADIDTGLRLKPTKARVELRISPQAASVAVQVARFCPLAVSLLYQLNSGDHIVVHPLIVKPVPFVVCRDRRFALAGAPHPATMSMTIDTWAADSA